MPERYPDDNALLALTHDETTGVPYIPTGASPYHLLFRRMLHRLLRATERANDLRVYIDGDLTVGVRPGRCFVGEQPIDFPGTQALPLDANETTWLWLDDAGQIQSDHTALPADRGTFIPLAKVITSQTTIDSVTDLRGQAMLTSISAAGMGITATAEQINQALDGITPNVTAMALSFLCAGSTTTADALHRHQQSYQDTAGEAYFRLVNASHSEQASIALRFALPNQLTGDTRLEMDADTGWLRQRRINETTYYLLGSVHPQYRHEGTLTTNQTGKLIGAVPVPGQVADIILSLGDNLQTNDNDDHIHATVKVNGVALCTTDPAIAVTDGPGFRSTAQGDGTPAVVKDDDTPTVARGDLLTVDLHRTAQGAVSTEASDVVVLVAIRALAPA